MNVFELHKLSNEEIISHVTDSPSSTKIEIELALRLANTQIDLLSLQNELDSLRNNTSPKSLIDGAGILVRPQIKVE